MKRLLVLTATTSLAAVALFSSQSSAQTSSAAAVRGFTERVTASVTPRRDRFRPYTFRTRGRVVPPGRFCAAGVNPIAGSTGNCIPLVCPPGATNAAYCMRPGMGVICSGKVNVRVQKRTTTISSRNVNVRSDCSYRSTVSFRTLVKVRRGALRVRARFQGNTVLRPKTSPTRTVRAG